MKDQKKAVSIASERVQLLSPLFAEGLDPAKAREIKQRICEQTGLSERTLRRYLANYREEGFSGLKEFQGRSYDMLLSHTTIVFSRYILPAWQHRQSTDQRSFGGLFHLLCDEVGTIDWAIALQQLVDMINEIAAKAGMWPYRRLNIIKCIAKACNPPGVI